MASQRRAPTKRPPRPAAKKPPPPPSAAPDGADTAERVSKTVTPGTAPTAKAAAPAPKSAPAGGGQKTNSGGPNYRPPTGTARGRRPPPPPPRRKKPKVTKKAVGLIVVLSLVALLVVFFSLAVNGSTSDTKVASALLGPEQVAVPKAAILAAVDSARYPAVIDGIKCETNEQVAYHIHVHLTIFVDGQARQIPYGIGMTPPLSYNQTNGTFVNGGACFYYLHTHAADGIIHVEAPNQTTYTLGQFFDMWGQPLKAGQVGPALGAMKVFLNGKPYTGDVRAIPLTKSAQIQLNVGSPSPAPSTITFPTSL